MKKLLRFLAAALGVLVALAAATFVAVGLATTRLERTADGAWKAQAGSVGDFHAKYPELAPNDAALGLEALTAAMGLDTATVGLEPPVRARPDNEAKKRLEAVRSDLKDYLKSEIEATRSLPEAAPVAVAGFLEAHAADITAIEDHLLAGEAPVWDRDLSAHQNTAAPVPNLLGQLTLQQILMTRVLTEIREGRLAQAHRTFDAARRQAAYLHDRPELICVLVGISMSRDHLGVLRKLPGREAERLAGLAQDEWRPDVLRGLEFDAWWLGNHSRSPDLNLNGVIPGRIGRSYVRLSAASYSRIMQRAVAALGKADGCTLDAQQFDQDATEAIPCWNVIGQIALPKIAPDWIRATQLALGVELTAHVLRVREAAAANGAWPESLDGTSSRACPGRTWLCELRPDGGIAIRLDQPLPEAAAPMRPTLPTSFVAPALPPATTSR